MPTADEGEPLPILITLLKEIGAPYKLVGGLAVAHHGYINSITNQIDLLIAREAFEALKKRSEDHGFIVVSARRLRHLSTETVVEALLAGEPIPRSTSTYPSPESVESSPRDSRFVGLRALVELKLHLHRGQDLADVAELLKKLDDGQYAVLESEIPRELREQLTALRREAIKELAWAEQDEKREQDYDRDDDGS